jgi:DNA polymerase V
MTKESGVVDTSMHVWYILNTMHLYSPAKFPIERQLPLVRMPIPAGFPSPAADYVETRIDLHKELIRNPSFTFFAYAEGDSMFPEIRDGDLMVIDRKVEQSDGSIVLASVSNSFCVKRLFRWPDGSIELRSDNPKYESIHLPSEFEGDFEIFGRVIWSIHNTVK